MDTIQQQIYTNLALARLKPGHHTRDRTAGIDDADKVRFEGICDRWGVYEPGTDFRRALLQIPLWDDAPPPADPSHTLIVLTSNKGRDAGGRLGALLRHIVCVPAEMHARVEYHPFRLLEQGLLREEWSPSDALGELQLRPQVTEAVDLQQIFPERYPLLRAVLAQLLETGAMRIPVDTDSAAIEEVFAQVLTLTPVAHRRHLSLSTYGFSNADDFQLAAIHGAGARVRSTLEKLEAGPQPATGADVATYLDELFGCLESRDWARALTLISTSRLPFHGHPHPLAVTAREPEPDERPTTSASRAAATPEDSTRPKPAAAEPAHHPRWQESPTSSGGGGRRWILGLVTAALLVATGWFLVSRGILVSGGQATPAVVRLVELRADGLTSFLDRHETLLGALFAEEVHDRDLRDALESAARSLASRTAEAVAADLGHLDRDLSPATDDAPADLAALAATVRLAAEAAATDQPRLEALEHLLTSADLAAIRTELPNAGERVELSELQPGDAPGAVASRLLRTSAALQDIADVLETMSTQESNASDTWEALGDRLQDDLSSITAEYTASPVTLLRCQQAVASYLDLRAAEGQVDLPAAAAAVPYDSVWRRDRRLAAAATEFAGDLAELTAHRILAPRPLRLTAGFYRFSDDGRLREPAGSTAEGAANLLRDLASACGPEASLDCEDTRHGALVARWRLEAWRVLGGPETRPGRNLIEEIGTAVLPAGTDEQLLSDMVSIVDRMEAAGRPTTGPLLDSVTARSRYLPDGLFHDICVAWEARVEHRTADAQHRFEVLYEQLREELQALRVSTDANGASAFAAVQTTVENLENLDLAAMANQPGFSDRTAAIRALRNTLARSRPVHFQRIDLELMTREDYAGDRHPEARPIIQIARVRGSSVTNLYSRQAPNSIAVNRGGYDPISIQLNTSIPISPHDTLLVTILESDGGLWCHGYFDPPPHGHVVAILQGLHTVQVSAAAREAVLENPEQPPVRSSHGDDLAMLRFVLSPGFWSSVGNQCPELP